MSKALQGRQARRFADAFLSFPSSSTTASVCFLFLPIFYFFHSLFCISFFRAFIVSLFRVLCVSVYFILLRVFSFLGCFLFFQFASLNTILLLLFFVDALGLRAAARVASCNAPSYARSVLSIRLGVSFFRPGARAILLCIALPPPLTQISVINYGAELHQHDFRRHIGLSISGSTDTENKSAEKLGG